MTGRHEVIGIYDTHSEAQCVCEPSHLRIRGPRPCPACQPTAYSELEAQHLG